MFFLFLITFPGTIHYADEKPFYPIEVHVNFSLGGHKDIMILMIHLMRHFTLCFMIAFAILQYCF